MFDISPVEVLIVLVIALLVFGPKRLPEMARGLGKGIRDFKQSMEGGMDDAPAPRAPAPDTVAATPATTAATSIESAPAAAPATQASPGDDLEGMVVPGSQRPGPAA